MEGASGDVQVVQPVVDSVPVRGGSNGSTGKQCDLVYVSDLNTYLSKDLLLWSY